MSEEKELKKRKISEKLEHKVKLVEKRDRMLIKDRSSERAVLEEVFDKSTLMTIYDFMNKHIIDEIFGVVKAGKEARVYWGKDFEGKEIAIKIYLTVSAEFKRGKLPYIIADPRFANVKRDTRSLVYAWAQKEFKNLELCCKAGVRVPKPIAVRNNVLVMEFIGKNGVPAPLMREVQLSNPERTYKQLITYLKRLYRKARLVHGDISEYNIMIWRGKPVLIDVSQAVPLEHPNSETFLLRDLKNLNRYFKRLGVEIIPIEELYRRVTGVHSKYVH